MTGPELTLPNFVVVGAMKCATTSLCAVLSQHPDIFVFEPKEPEFFCGNDFHPNDLAQYAALFADSGGATAIGEGSTSYTKSLVFPNAAHRLATHLPTAKLIYIMRDPIKRIESHWLHSKRTIPGFSESFRESLERHPNYIDTSLYWKQYQNLRQHFEEDQILLLLFEDFKSDPQSVIDRCLDFLDVDPSQSVVTVHEHRSIGSRVDRPIISSIQSLGFARVFLDLLPLSAKDCLKRPFQKRINSRPSWDQDTLQWILEQVRPDWVRSAQCAR